MRIALINILQETDDFNPELTTLDVYRSFNIIEGEAMLTELRGVGQVGGYIEAIEESGLDVDTIPIIRAFAVAGGRISKEAFDFFHEKIRKGLEGAGKIDGLALQLHGACAAEGIDDVEGEQAALCRKILGPGVPISLGLDHHANITQKMIDSVDIIAGHRTQPHDTMDTGRIATELLLKLIRKEAKPVARWRKIPMISHQEQFLTSRPPMKTWFDRAREMEKDPRVLQCSNYPMQPWLDVAEGGWSTIVVTDNDPELADKLADELADLAWSMRDDFQVKDAIPVDDAVLKADAADKGVVVISDTGDTVFGGSSGDSNIILEAMLRLGIKGPALVPMISPKAVEKLAAAGVGAEVTLPLGGEIATAFFTPLEVTGTVRFVGDDIVPVKFLNHSGINMGKRVIFEVGPVTMLITELRGAAGNVPGVYEASGVNVRDYKMAVMKTASNFQLFDEVSSGVIRADTKGPGQSDVFTLPWKRLPRPIYPLEKFGDWRTRT